jgi:hypothetical protein
MRRRFPVATAAERSVVATIIFPRLRVTTVGRPLPYLLVLIPLLLLVLLAAIGSGVLVSRRRQLRLS